MGEVVRGRGNACHQPGKARGVATKEGKENGVVHLVIVCDGIVEPTPGADYSTKRSKSAIWPRITSRLERQKSMLWMSMWKRVARVTASARPVEERKSS
jgi:hypothetical protein